MDFSQLVGKIIADRNSRKLGFVVDIRNVVTSSFEREKPTATMLVKIERAFKEAITVEAEVVEILKIDGYYAWLDTTKKEFFESIKNTKSITQERKEPKIIDLSILNINPPQPATEKTSNKNQNSKGELSESSAFMEYTSGRSRKIKTPWIAIVILGLSTAILSLLIYIFSIVAFDNPYAMNMIIGLLGLPAGFIIAFKNKTFDIMVSWRYSTLTGIIYTVIYFIIGAIISSINSLGLNNLFGGITALLLSCLLIGVFSILVTFAGGALLGTMIHGYMDNKR
ncbi:MAG TPA: TIGR04086 family membrane protein [Candidatus Bathyarchaeia archaeon]|nr:TIGR04086 family membrane protein [Candidatus Bathyarchaeia archaeon]